MNKLFFEISDAKKHDAILIQLLTMYITQQPSSDSMLSNIWYNFERKLNNRE